jgi:hypothetical protein
MNHLRHSGPYVSQHLTFTHPAFFCLLRFLQQTVNLFLNRTDWVVLPMETHCVLY